MITSKDSMTHAVAFDLLQETVKVETCQVQIVKGVSSQQKKIYKFSKDLILIGAHPRCDIQIDDGTVSRFHCEIHRDQEGYRLVDGGSTNGTYVGDLRIRDVYLKPAIEFQIGNTTLSFLPEVE